jgi:hypothetical protein
MAFDVSELARLEKDLGKATDDVVKDARPLVQRHAASVKDAWRAGARKSSGSHGRLYPAAITYETRVRHGAVEGVVGPDASKPQGGMSFELGSSKQPPHLDGFTAARAEEPRFVKSVEKLTEDLL